jgi:hypothetical protein
MEYVSGKPQERIELVSENIKLFNERITNDSSWIVLYNENGSKPISGIVKKVKRNKIYLYDRFIKEDLSKFNQKQVSLEIAVDDYKFVQVIGIPDLRTHIGIGHYLPLNLLEYKDLILFSSNCDLNIGFVNESVPGLDSDLIQKYLNTINSSTDIKDRFFMHLTLSNPMDNSPFKRSREVYSLQDDCVIHSLRYEKNKGMYINVRSDK